MQLRLVFFSLDNLAATKIVNVISIYYLGYRNFSDERAFVFFSDHFNPITKIKTLKNKNTNLSEPTTTTMIMSIIIIQHHISFRKQTLQYFHQQLT